ncbi:GRF1-interacting factor 1 [Hibiscus syriacus]|uniref:GRF1-interacting factor 1 n=1 Tax=Hibiscus syriacus TaxID=106335 RepID=A0A6A3BW40_HIBSY|nr:GRF1-interacting factor 1 [Hibiscus syriacus]
MQQQLMKMQPMMAAYYPNNVTTDHIQQYLDENKSLILKIVESQNSGKLSECADQGSRFLQESSKAAAKPHVLAAIADSQPQPPTMHAQFPSGGIMQPGGGHYMQHQQAQQMTQQPVMAARSSMLYAQQPFSALQQHQPLHGQLGMSSGGLHMLQTDSSTAGGSGALGAGGFPDFGRGSPGEGIHGGKQDIGSGGSAEGRGGSSGGQGGDGGETLYLKAADEGN